MRRFAAVVVIALLAAGCAGREQLSRKDQVIRHALDSTVQLFTEREGGVTRAGSGVIVSVDDSTGQALVLTTAHLLEPPVEQIVTVLSPPGSERMSARIRAVDPKTDLALVEVEGLSGAATDMRSAANLGDRIWVVAFPWGRERTVVSGVISQVARVSQPVDGRAPLGGPVRLIDASVSYGMSGGGIFDQENGALLGLVRGYRSAELSFPGVATGALTLPVAGETTVISVPKIHCFLGQPVNPSCTQNTAQ